MITNDYLLKFTKMLEIEHNRFSCLTIALRDARQLTGRNLETGKNELNILESSDSFLDPNSFIGIINYLLILDMIGEIFKIKGFRTSKKSKIYFALKQFGGDISDKEIDAIIALRNSLAHNYGLINIPRQEERETKLHKFSLLNGENSFLINFPDTPWNGEFSNKEDANSTEISVSKLIELIEEIHKELIRQIEANNVELRFSKGKEELNSRFTIRH
jgi:hypothetical protein